MGAWMERLRQLIHEVHRRSLWQVLGIYAVASWAVLQVVDTLGGALNLPDGFDSVALALLILGLPIVAATAFLAGGAVRDTTAVRETGRPAETASHDMAGVAAHTPSGLWRQIAVTFAALFILAAGVAGWSFLRPAPPKPVTRVSVQFPEDQSIDPTWPDLDLSPDGSLLVYLGGDGAGPPQLWLRRWDELNATPIRGTEDAAHPAISPEGLEVAFDQGGAIRIVPLQGGGPRTLIEVGNSQPVWSPDGEWVYFRNGLGLSRIPTAGGEEEIITEVNRAGGEDGHAFVIVLPGGRKILYQVLALAAEPSIRALDLETGQDKVLTLGGYPRYSSTGHLLFLDDTATLLAAPFDVEKLELTGAARPLAEQLLMFSNGRGFFKVSEAGKLVYVTEGGCGRPRKTGDARMGRERRHSPRNRSPMGLDGSSVEFRSCSFPLWRTPRALDHEPRGWVRRLGQAAGHGAVVTAHVRGKGEHQDEVVTGRSVFDLPVKSCREFRHLDQAGGWE